MKTLAPILIVTALLAAVPLVTASNVVINFLVIAFVIFLIVKQANRLKKPAPAPAAPATKDCPYCASGIPLKAVRCPLCTSALT